MQHATLLFLIRDNQILLGLKKRGFGQGKIGGLGGKVEPGETIEEAAIRELHEECGVSVERSALVPVAHLQFSFPNKPGWGQIVHAFISATWSGEPRESEEIVPRWYAIEAIPYDKMWADGAHWLPLVLQGQQVDAAFTFADDNESIGEMHVSTIGATDKT
jgi:8-oxo-dGTP diphosphatase